MGGCWKACVDEKLISQSKKELENFIRAKFEDYNPGRASQTALKTVLPVRSQDTVYISFLRQGCASNDSLHNPDLRAIVVGHVTLYKIKKECYLLRSCLVDAGRMLLFMVKQVFLLMGEVR